jgi:hypothetical protein
MKSLAVGMAVRSVIALKYSARLMEPEEPCLAARDGASQGRMADLRAFSGEAGIAPIGVS